MKSKKLVLLVCPPGDLQIGLQALLTTHFDMDVLVTGDGSSALLVIDRHNPSLIILDNDLPKNTAPIYVDTIKAQWPEILCVLFVNDEKERQKYKEVGADLTIIKGLPGSKLIEKIKTLFHRENKN